MFVRELTNTIILSLFANQQAVALAIECMFMGVLLSLLAVLKPYESFFVSAQEALLTGCVCLLAWCGAIISLLTDNKESERFLVLKASITVLAVFVACFTICAVVGGIVYSIRKKFKIVAETMGAKKQQVMFDMMLREQMIQLIAAGSDSSDEEVRERRARTLRQKYAFFPPELPSQ